MKNKKFLTSAAVSLVSVLAVAFILTRVYVAVSANENASDVLVTILLHNATAMVNLIAVVGYAFVIGGYFLVGRDAGDGAALLTGATFALYWLVDLILQGISLGAAFTLDEFTSYLYWDAGYLTVHYVLPAVVIALIARHLAKEPCECGSFFALSREPQRFMIVSALAVTLWRILFTAAYLIESYVGKGSYYWTSADTLSAVIDVTETVLIQFVFQYLIDRLVARLTVDNALVDPKK